MGGSLAGEVTAWLEYWIGVHAGSRTQQALLGRALDGLRAQLAGWRDPTPPPWLHLPVLLYAGLGGHSNLVPLGAATCAVFLALDTLDDLADGDDPPWWDGCSRAQRSLAGATFLCAVPQGILAELDTSAGVRDRLQRILAEGFLRMGAGQERDLAHMEGVELTVEAVERSVAEKSGEEIGTFARLAAELAGADPGTVVRCGRLGCAAGTATQLASDCYELFQDPECRDLAHGAWTLPLAIHRSRLGEADRAGFERLLLRARAEAEAREEVRRLLREAGVLRRCAFRVEVQVQRGLRLLDELHLREPAAMDLRRMLRGASFFAENRP